jgi:PPOX class probable F420-dependent enzyme
VIEAEARRRFAAAPVGRPHLVPIVFALAANTIYHGVDAKPKRHTDLRRVTNLDANPHACVLVDHYDEDWDTLWWIRADGTARDVDAADPEGRHAQDLLAARYPRYRLRGRLLAITVTRWSSWSAT